MTFLFFYFQINSPKILASILTAPSCPARPYLKMVAKMLSCKSVENEISHFVLLANVCGKSMKVTTKRVRIRWETSEYRPVKEVILEDILSV